MMIRHSTWLYFLGHPVYVANFNKSIKRDLNDKNKTRQPFISPILYRYSL